MDEFIPRSVAQNNDSIMYKWITACIAYIIFGIVAILLWCGRNLHNNHKIWYYMLVFILSPLYIIYAILTTRVRFTLRP